VTAQSNRQRAVLPLFYERHSRTSQTFATALSAWQGADSLWWYAGISSGATTGRPASALSSRSGSRIDKVTEHHPGDPAAAALRAFQSERSLSTWLLLSGIAATSPRPPPGPAVYYDLHSYMRAG